MTDFNPRRQLFPPSCTSPPPAGGATALFGDVLAPINVNMLNNTHYSSRSCNSITPMHTSHHYVNHGTNSSRIYSAPHLPSNHHLQQRRKDNEAVLPVPNLVDSPYKRLDVPNENETTPPGSGPLSRLSAASSPCPPTPTRPKPRSPFTNQKNKPRRMSEQTKLPINLDEDLSDSENKHLLSYSVPDLRVIPADSRVANESLSSKSVPDVPHTPIRVVRYKTNINPYSPTRSVSKEIQIPTEKESVPRFVSDFEDQGEIGRGSFSTVILCLNRIDGWTYAIKKLIYHTEKMKNKYLKEAYALAALGQHENLVRYYGSWEDTSCNAIYIQTEWCKGGCLRNHLPSFNQSELCKIILQVSKALSFMHATGIPHGDVKPENILVDTPTVQPTSIYKLCDLGQINESGDGKYLAPELLNIEDCAIEKHLIGKADIFSLGMTIYELAYERVHDSPLPIKQRSQITAEDIVLPSDHYTVEFVLLLREMMEREPNIRPAAGEVLKHGLIRSDTEWQLHLERQKVSLLMARIEELEQELQKCKVKGQ